MGWSYGDRVPIKVWKPAMSCWVGIKVYYHTLGRSCTSIDGTRALSLIGVRGPYGGSVCSTGRLVERPYGFANRFLVLHHYLSGIIVGLIIIWLDLGVIQNRTISVGVSLAVASSMLSAWF